MLKLIDKVETVIMKHAALMASLMVFLFVFADANAFARVDATQSQAKRLALQAQP